VKAEAGAALFSVSTGFGEDVGLESLIECSNGGGSMKVVEFDGTTGSGSKGISSPAADVSIVMLVVGLIPP